MTEKRFTLAYEKGNWWAVRDGDITLWKEEVVGLLNQLNDENEQLKERNNRQAQTIDELWSLIKANDWTKLKEMVEENKKNEELLHREFKCYIGDKR